ncbi:MAG: hypothetical protein A2X67_12805 [Ignavibacteria bacterium GWA2_55_11]|nr:MAG: hypothetical protein A2X67_12805 [Ignavibacteria bacterium GWA2_55_11]
MAMHTRSGFIVANMVLCVGLLVGVTDAFGHGKGAHKKTAGKVAPSDSSAVAKMHADSLAIAETDTEHHPDKDQPFVLEPWEALREHLHNKLVHFPVGFALAAFVVSLVSLRRTELQSAVRVLGFIAATGSLFAYFTGVAQAPTFAGSPQEWVVDVHRWLGISTAVTLWVWAAFESLRPLRRFALLVGCVVVLLVLITGFFGGILAHA